MSLHAATPEQPAAQPAPASALASPPLHVRKRQGPLVPWDTQRVARAVALAMDEVQRGPRANLLRDNAKASFGVEPEVWQRAQAVAGRVERMARHRFAADRPPTIEQVQDLVELALVAEGEHAVAHAYTTYRSRQAEARRATGAENGLGEYIALSRYCRYRPELGRRELWGEAVERVRNMHLRNFAHLGRAPLGAPEGLRRLQTEGLLDDATTPLFAGLGNLAEEIWNAFEQVRAKAILPSMRSLQFGGRAIEAAHARMYNCSFSYADRPAFFRECFYLLLCGTGVGFSVQRHHVDHLPPLPVRPDEMELPVSHYVIGDSIEGWADAVDELLKSFWEGRYVEFSYRDIRPRGTPIRTAGGKAPGHLPLKRCLKHLEALLRGASGRRLRPIEVFDMVMFIAQAVLSGGVRRSATLCLFSADDAEMANAKTGNWFETHPQRCYANISALLVRGQATEAHFRTLFESQKQYGEPGFYFAESPDYGTNPCAEIGLFPKLRRNPAAPEQALLFGGAEPSGEAEELSGWQMCNLTTINGGRPRTATDFYRLCQAAALVGTLQAAYTDIPYLGPISRLINEREALLGVSICGILDHPKLFLDPVVLETGARVVRATNALVAEAIGIARAARTTCVKPEGTASLLLETGSGIHPHHARRYFRRVQANRLDPVYQHFRRANPQLCESSVYNPSTDDVITFAVEAPPGAICRRDVNALSFLQMSELVQRHWVMAGRQREDVAPGLHHNVSQTVTVAPHEWEAVAAHIWAHRDSFTGVALLQEMGDKAYAQAPREEVESPEDEVKWSRLVYQPVDYAALHEADDQTKLRDVAACAGGQCELPGPG